MKKLLLCVTCAVISSAVFAGGIENKTNMSTGYLRNPSRNTENSRPESAFYNIAGSAFMEDGLYIEAGNQFIFKEYKHELNENQVADINTQISPLGLSLNSGTYNDETTVFLYPNADIVYKFSNFSIFANFGVYAGGGKLEYTEGTAATELAFFKKASAALNGYTQLAEAGLGSSEAAQKYLGTANLLTNIANNHSLKVTSITYGEQLGLAYNILDFISVSAGVRFLEGSQDLSVKSAGFAALLSVGTEISCEASAFGVSPVFGLHVKPLSRLDIAAQVQVATKMEYEVNSIKGEDVASQIGITKDTTFRADLPTALNLGVGYQITDPLYVSTSFNYYFNKGAECNSILGKNDYDDSFEIALGADYRFNEKILASLGVAYGNQGTTDDSNNIFNPVLDSFQVGFGAEYTPIKALTITAGGTYVKYFEADYYIKSESNSFKTTLNKNLFMLSLGLTYKPF